MTILESLESLNSFPIPDLALERICIDRELTSTSDYSKSMGESEAYQLATADVYMFLSEAPSIVEQEVGVNQAIAIKRDLKKKADAIYGLYNDLKGSGEKFGYVGENFNG